MSRQVPLPHIPGSSRDSIVPADGSGVCSKSWALASIR